MPPSRTAPLNSLPGFATKGHAVPVPEAAVQAEPEPESQRTVVRAGGVPAGRVQLGLRLDPARQDALRTIAFTSRTSVQAIFEVLIDEFLERHRAGRG